MTRYTYNSHSCAHYGDDTVIVPDQVADAQADFDGRSFPALRLHRWSSRPTGQRVRVYLRGDLYGLHTPGTGNMRVTSTRAAGGV